MYYSPQLVILSLTEQSRVPNKGEKNVLCSPEADQLMIRIDKVSLESIQLIPFFNYKLSLRDHVEKRIYTPLPFFFIFSVREYTV